MAVIECPDPLACPKEYEEYTIPYDYTTAILVGIMGYVLLRVIK